MRRRFALLFTNTDFDDPIFQKLDAPDRDAHAFERILTDKDRCGFEVTLLQNASKATAERHILNFFRNRSQDDLLVLYYAGHGLINADGALYFAMRDTEREAVKATALSAEFINQRVIRSSSENVVLLLDCHFGALFSGTTSSIEGSVDLRGEFEGRGRGPMILTATDAIQYAWESTTNEMIGEAENSHFTRYLVEGISSGEADRNADGEISVSDLYTYVFDRTVKTFPRQLPQKIVSQQFQDYVIASNPAANNLSSDLRSAITHPNHQTRIGAVGELEELLYLYDGQNPQLVEECLKSLKKLEADPNQSISRQAGDVLKAFEQRDTAIIPDHDIKTLRLFISSPDDVTAERHIVRKVVAKLIQDPVINKLGKIEIVAEAVPMNGHAPPQRATNDEMLKPSKCDIVVVMFWSKMGTPLPADTLREDGTRYESETEWEYEDAVRAAKNNAGHPSVLLYRSNRAVLRRPGELNPTDLAEKFEQFKKVEHFFSRFKDTDGSLKGGYNSYNSVEQFEDLLERHLRIVIRRQVTGVKDVSATTKPSVPAPAAYDVKELITPYLHWVIEQHSQLELRGLGGDARLPKIPLEKVYVALKGSRSNTYEREQSQALLNAEQLEILEDLDLKDLKDLSASELAQILYLAERRAIITNPYMPSLEERDRPAVAAEGANAPVVTLGEAFCKERWMVILGDPGSGKTTLARWLALKLATAMLNKEPSVQVPAYQIDPKVERSDPTIIDLGPPRLPVLLRVSEFSDAYQKARQNLETLSLIDFLGHQSWLGHYSNLPREGLNLLIKHFLRMPLGWASSMARRMPRPMRSATSWKRPGTTNSPTPPHSALSA